MAAKGGGQRGPSKHEVAIRDIDRKSERDSQLIKAIETIGSIAAVGVPIWALNFVIQPLAGQKTEIVATVPLSIGVAVSVGFNFFQGIKGHARKQEMIRLREKKTEAEVRLLEYSDEPDLIG